MVQGMKEKFVHIHQKAGKQTERMLALEAGGCGGAIWSFITIVDLLSLALSFSSEKEISTIL